ncbi:hypothetical protein CR983_01615 [Candidatus Saccharibacteria bacterium]|nr:MAG: hypothetical protein CR983_01615 [Candidatus Saccharibacteria bacterium]
MIKKLGSWLYGAMTISLILCSLVVITPTPAHAACQNRLLTFPTWHRGLTDSNCEVVIKNNPSGGQHTLRDFIYKLALNIVEILLQLVGYVSVGFIIVGGFRYMVAAGSSDRIAGAKKTILNAIIGLIISVVSVAIVNAVAGAF